MSEALTVRLRYDVAGTDGPWEDEAAAWFADHPDQKPDLYDQEGSIFVTGDGGEAQVRDQLLSSIPMMCFDAVVTVLDAGVVEFSLANAPTGVRLTLVGDRIEIVSNVFAAVRFPKWETLEGLVACGERFLRLAETVWAGDGYEGSFAYMGERAKAARAALDAARG
jgi:hypothetical protein